MSTLRRFHRAASVSLFVAGCLGASGFGLVGSACKSGPSRTDFIASYCSKFTPCCKTAGLPGDTSSCTLFVSLFAGTAYDSTAGQACLDAIDKASSSPGFCDDPGNAGGAACGKVFGASGTVAPGGACHLSSECAPSSEGKVACVGTLTNMTLVETCEVQIVGKAGSSPCIGSIRGRFSTVGLVGNNPPKGYTCDIANGIYCDASSMQCAPAAMEGQSCMATESCAGGMYCDSGTQTCAPVKAAGSACLASADCAPGLYCDSASKTCADVVTNGGACKSNEACVSGSCDATGKCVPNAVTLSIYCGSMEAG